MDSIASKCLNPKCFYKAILFLTVMLFISTSLLTWSRSNPTHDISTIKKWDLQVQDPERPLHPKINSTRFVVRGVACLNDSIYLGLKGLVKPPNLNSSQFAKELQHFWRYMAANSTSLASRELSTIVQGQISQIQEMGCDGPNLQCGHQDNCGFGCQMHHRIACLMISYITQLPLIHTPDCDGWGFMGNWTEILQPLGSNCTPGNRTIVWSWNPSGSLALKDCRNPDGDVRNGSRIPYPLELGIPLAPELADMIESLTPDPFRWIIGEFTKYVMKWNPSFAEMVENSKSQIGFSNSGSGNGTPIVGIHVRRTDKSLEWGDTVHSTTVYMDEVETYFKGLEGSQGLQNNTLKRRVFVASESPSILKECRKIHPTWEILGFESKYSESLSSRKDGLFEIARDVALLSQSDFVICGFSSNVCRLVHEMQTWVGGMDLKGSSSPRGNGQQLSQQLGGGIRVKSLNAEYNYLLLYYQLRKMRIYTIDC